MTSCDGCDTPDNIADLLKVTRLGQEFRLCYLCCNAPVESNFSAQINQVGNQILFTLRKQNEEIQALKNMILDMKRKDNGNE